MEWFENLSKDSQKLFVGVVIFVSGLTSLIFGGSISNERTLGISIPMMLLGVIAAVVGFFCLIDYLATWWHKR